jgi:valyl-tRNA synthetase
MIFSSLEHMGEVPFHTVFIHGIVRDALGRKMSKSLGNGIDPLELIDEYGADALRLTLAVGNAPGGDMRFSDEKVKASRNFANKVWNAARFIMLNIEGEKVPLTLPERLTAEDRWVISRFNRLAGEVTDNIERYELGIAVGKLYDFIWDIFCDWYIELCKARLSAGGEGAMDARRVLCWVLGGALRLLHPFMPHITEEIWQSLPHEGDSIMTAVWPQYDSALDFASEADDFEMVIRLIRAVRNARAEANVPSSRKTKLLIQTDRTAIFTAGAPFIERLAYASEVQIAAHFDLSDAMQVVTDEARIFIPLDELIDRDKELARLQKELSACEREIELVGSRLQNENFVTRAPANVIEGERGKLAKATERKQKIEESIRQLIR